MTSDRDLLRELASFLANRVFIEGDAASIRDMVQRYGHPPLSLAYPVAMKMTKTEYRRLTMLLLKVNEHLKTPPLELPIERGNK